MENQKTPVQRLDLIKSSLSYNIYIPLSVEKKIRILCREIHNVEWSGVLFYKIDGNFEDGSLLITCVDIFQMDEGSSTYTEFDMSADVMNYMIEHPELISNDIYQGLIHSHNNMPTFFSGTDTGTLLSEGTDINHFVSLIVNNAGVYTAGITRRLTVNQIVNEEYTYPSWNDTTASGSREFTASKTYVQWFNLTVTVDKVPGEDESEIISRIREIRNNKASKKTTTIIPAYPITKKLPTIKEVEPEKHKINKEEDEYAGDLSNNESEDLDVNYNVYHFSDITVDSIVKQLITLSLVLNNESSLDVMEWCNNMEKIFDNRFKDVVDFETVAVNIVDYILNDEWEEDSLMYLSPRETTAVLAKNVQDALKELPTNKYINSLISICDDYIF